MKDDIPKFHETFIPILKVLSSGKILHYKEMREKVTELHYNHLPENLLNERTKTGQILIFNRIGWAKSYLKEAGFIHQPERGMVQITEKGSSVLKKGSLSLQELKSDSDYIFCQKNKDKSSPKEKATSKFDQQQLENFTPQDLIEHGFNSIEKEIKADLLEKLKEIDPYYFEKVILFLLKRMGYGEFVETKKSNDGGIDGVINQDQLGLEKIFIQAKRYSENKIREKDIRNFIGAMSGDTSKGVFVTTSKFDQNAIIKAREAHHVIILIDGIKLADLMYQYGIGVQTQEIFEIKQVDEDFFENA